MAAGRMGSKRSFSASAATTLNYGRANDKYRVRLLRETYDKYGNLPNILSIYIDCTGANVGCANVISFQ